MTGADSRMGVEVRILRAHEAAALQDVADVFDHPINAEAAQRFLASPNHHLAVAIDAGRVVGFVSAVHYEHPDKPRPELWINEVGVAESHRRRGLAKALLARMLEHARELGCREAWVLTERDNEAALSLYAAAGAEAPTEAMMFTFRLDDGARGD